MKLVDIEFVKDTERRKKGDRLRVDQGSAQSLVDVKKVAKRVNDAKAKPAAKSKPVEPVDDGDDA